MSSADIAAVSKLFLLQAVHVKNLEDVYCDNLSIFNESELLNNFKNQLSELLNNPDTITLISIENNQIAGFLIGTIIPCRVPGFLSNIEKVGYLDEAYVLPEYRQKGILKAMEESALCFFREQNIKYVELNFFDANDSAKKSWEALGYKIYMEYARNPI
jgi:ribosomal protein S18 acetylase RimI-like enzyme